MLGSLFNKATRLQGWNTGASCEYCEILRAFFCITPLVAAFNSPFKVSCLFFNFTPPRAFDFDQKLTQNVTQVIINYHVTKQIIFCLNCLITCLSILEKH